MLNIPCVLRDTGRIDSEWNKSLDGLTGFIVHAEKSAWEGYQVEVRVDNPPDWIKGKKNNNIVRCVYVAETRGRDIIAEISDADMEKLRLWIKGIVKCESCGATLPDHEEGCFTLRQIQADDALFENA